MRCLLIEEADRLILVDTGMGDKQDAKFFSHYYLSGDDSLMRSLNKKGFSADDITDVILTHLHFDHCGGAVIRENDTLLPAFKNATYWSNKKHWDWAVNPNEREKASFLKENILPLQESGQLKFIDTINGVQFSDDISIRFAYGHTEAMMLPQIRYRDRTIIYMADLLPSSGHIPLPYVMAYDMFPLITLKEKKLFLEEACRNNYILYFEHDPVNECCTLHNTEKGIRADRVFSLGEL
jgi:glyoxylase-like metal-dependent hydrolase (beta-lactamase superfamily II)